ncbi:hypothetical protein GHT06_019042 [Daphnia sinensis]|uniref:RNase H type-1 domain-containing protein n=1 Tax=Daphnia sinensis TaxID=1820382 RepID=A0AAD5L153_9CRUS|nr:hypothetical protein GHT06_019042 [Daphnia sinensis]
MDDFPKIDAGQTFLFADDVEFHISASDGEEAERLLTPYMEKIQRWSRKWRIKFSATKSSLINFTRQRKQQMDPILTTEIVIEKARGLKNLFKILAQSKHGPSIESLRTLYIALMRGKIEYGLIVYGASSKTRQLKLEKIQNSILRTTLAAPITTPIKEMQCELALDPIETRRLTLAGPGHIVSAGLDLSQEVPIHFQRMEPPWRPQQIELRYFPMSKMEALSNSAAAKALFHELVSNLNSARMSYTDGSAQKDTGKTTYGIYIPSLDLEETGTMRKGTSIFTAETHAILRAMEITHSHHDWTEELAIFTDSKSVVIAENLKSSGTKTTIYWVPSHVGIPSNERTHQLAATEYPQISSPPKKFATCSQQESKKLSYGST